MHVCFYFYFHFPTPNYPLYVLYFFISQSPFFSLSHSTQLKSLHSGVLLFFLFFLISSSKLCARPFPTEQGEHFVLELEPTKSFKEWLVMKDCNRGDEECLIRRMTLEAHIDYIYTDRHKP